MKTTALLFRNESSEKFWTLHLDGQDIQTHWGRIGTAGQKKTKTFGSNEEAEKAATKAILGKRKKGYVDIDGEPPVQAAPVLEEPTLKTKSSPTKPKKTSAPKKTSVNTKAFLKKLERAADKDTTSARELLEASADESWDTTLARMFCAGRFDLSSSIRWSLSMGGHGVEGHLGVQVVEHALSLPSRFRRRHVLGLDPSVFKFAKHHYAAHTDAWQTPSEPLSDAARPLAALLSAYHGEATDPDMAELALARLAESAPLRADNWVHAKALGATPAEWGQRTLPHLVSAEHVREIEALEEALILAPWNCVLGALSPNRSGELAAGILRRRSDTPDELTALMTLVGERVSALQDVRYWHHLLRAVLPRLHAAGQIPVEGRWDAIVKMGLSDTDESFVDALLLYPAERLHAVFDASNLSGRLRLLRAAPDDGRYASSLEDFVAKGGAKGTADAHDFGEIGARALPDLERLFHAADKNEPSDKRNRFRRVLQIAILRALRHQSEKLDPRWDVYLVPHPETLLVLGTPTMNHFYGPSSAGIAILRQLPTSRVTPILAKALALPADEAGFSAKEELEKSKFPPAEL